MAKHLAFLGSIKDEIMDSEELATDLLVLLQQKVPAPLTERFTKLAADTPREELLNAICRSRGFLLRGGELDAERASHVALDEFRAGKIARVTLEQPEARDMTRLPERERLERLSEPDRAFWGREGVVLAGMDEVGRGPLAGPVVVCCAAMPPEPLIERVNDSKQVTEHRREALFPLLTETALGYALGWVEAGVIDEINILEATKLAFQQAFESMPILGDGCAG